MVLKEAALDVMTLARLLGIMISCPLGQGTVQMPTGSSGIFSATNREKNPLENQVDRVVITTDASLLGWGAHMEEAMMQGTWSRETKLHINVLELREIPLPLRDFASRIQGAHVLVRTDNVTAKTYFNRQGGTRSAQLSKEVSLLMTWAEQNLQACKVHVASLENNTANWLSRCRLQEVEWQLNLLVFQQVTE